MAYTSGKILVMTLAATVNKCSKTQTTLKDVSTQAGISAEKYMNWLKGMELPTEEEIKKICDYLEYPVKDFYEELSKNGGMTPPTTEAKDSEKSSKPASVKNDTPKGVKKEEPSTKKSTPPMKEEVLKKQAESSEQPKKVVEEPKKAPVIKEVPKEVPETTETIAPVKNTSKEKVKEPKPMEPVVIKKDPVKEKTPKTTKPAKNTKAVVKMLDTEMETRIRKLAGLKKTDIVDEPAIETSFQNIQDTIRQSFSYYEDLSRHLLQSFQELSEVSKIDPRYEELLEASKNASDEGIAVAITILKQFKK